jgi:hypothetical protein
MMDIKTWLKKPPIEYWPELRWWLAEGFHTDETLKKDIQMIYDAGFGAAEFLAMDEQGADSSLYGWGSEEWAHDTQTIIRETTEKQMGASLTSGTNWSNANLITIVPDDKAAAKELDYTVETLVGSQSHKGPLQKALIKKPNINVQELVAVVAVRRIGEENGKILLDKESAIVLTGNVSGENLNWTAPEGTWELFAFWIHGTGQTASPSVGVSYTINYIDRYGINALIDYWEKEVLTGELRDFIKKNGRVQMYMDSLELSTYGKGGQFWGYHLLEEFKKRRGYDLTPYLPFIVKKGGSLGRLVEYQYYYESENIGIGKTGDVFVLKTRNDLYQTMTDLYIDSMLKPMQEWLHRVGMTLRAEISYGMPFEISLPGKYVDGIETESLEFASQIEPYRNMAGPAHLFNRLFSSETGATMLNYQMGLDFYTQIIYTQFAAGVSRTVLHGYSSIAGADQSTFWPGHEGMLPVFSERFGSRQPAYRHYNDWTAMLARYQMILRQGKPRVDLGILRLDYDFNNMYVSSKINEKDLYESHIMRANQGVYWQSANLQNVGYTFDYFAPQILEDEDICYESGLVAPDGPGYKALIIYQEAIPLSSAKQILTWAKQGLPVILVNGVTERIRPAVSKTHRRAASITPFNGESDADLSTVIAEMKTLANVVELEDQSKINEALASLGIQPRAAFSEPNKNVLTNLREDGDRYYLFAYNYMYTHHEACTFSIAIEAIGKPYTINCWTGEIQELCYYTQNDTHTTVELTLMPGEAAMITLNTLEKDILHAVSTNACGILRRSDELAIMACRSGIYTTKLSDGTEVKTSISVPDAIKLKTWNLEVEDWNEGEKKTITEDRGLGYITNEVYYETKKTRIPVGETALKPWKDIPAVGPAVSGIGYYTATFTLPSDWNSENGIYLSIGSTNGNSAAVYVNEKKAAPYDFDRKAVDITKFLVSGENRIRVEVSSTLNNRLMDRNYHAIIHQIAEMMIEMIGEESEEMEEVANQMKLIKPELQEYGMTGEVKLVIYTVRNLK